MSRISYFPAGDESELSPEIQALYAKCREKLGFVPKSSSRTSGGRRAWPPG